MKTSHFIIGLMIASLSLSVTGIALAAPPSTTPTGANTRNVNGIFSDYFVHLVNSPCTGSIVTGFSNSESDYLTPKCKSIKEILHTYFIDSGLLSSSPIIFNLAGEAENLLSSASSQWKDVSNGIAYTGGNVAIGTESPNASLEIKRTIADGNFAGWFDGTQNTNYGLGVNIANTGNTIAIANFMSKYISRLFIRADGNIGIGTTSPSVSLEVKGNIIADTPTAPNHLATKAYVDAMLGGGGGGGCAIIGGRCGGGILAGVSRGYSIIITPPGCTDSITPTCDHYGTDTVKKTWNNGTSNWTTTNQTSTMDGYTNTMNLAANTDAGSPYQAAKYCADMIYGGYDDWYLPSVEEASAVGLNFGLILGGFASNSNYWLSNEIIGTSINYRYAGSMSTDQSSGRALESGLTAPKNESRYVRCIRKI